VELIGCSPHYEAEIKPARLPAASIPAFSPSSIMMRSRWSARS